MTLFFYLGYKNTTHFKACKFSKNRSLLTGLCLHDYGAKLTGIVSERLEVLPRSNFTY